MKGIYDAIYTALTAAGSFHTAVPNVYYDQGPQVESGLSALTPYLVWSVVVATNTGCYAGVNLKDYTIQFDLIDTKDNGAALATNQDLLLALMDRASLTASGFDKVVTTWLDDGTIITDGDALRCTSQLRAQATDF